MKIEYFHPTPGANPRVDFGGVPNTWRPGYREFEAVLITHGWIADDERRTIVWPFRFECVGICDDPVGVLWIATRDLGCHVRN